MMQSKIWINCYIFCFFIAPITLTITNTTTHSHTENEKIQSNHWHRHGHSLLKLNSIVLFLMCIIRKCKMMFWCYFNTKVDKLHHMTFTWSVGVNLHRLRCFTALQSQEGVNAKPLSRIWCATLSQCIQCACVQSTATSSMSIYLFIYFQVPEAGPSLYHNITL